MVLGRRHWWSISPRTCASLSPIQRGRGAAATVAISTEARRDGRAAERLTRPRPRRRTGPWPTRSASPRVPVRGNLRVPTPGAGAARRGQRRLPHPVKLVGPARSIGSSPVAVVAAVLPCSPSPVPPGRKGLDPALADHHLFDGDGGRSPAGRSSGERLSSRGTRSPPRAPIAPVSVHRPWRCPRQA